MPSLGECFDSQRPKASAIGKAGHVFFVGGTTMQEGPASTWAYIQPGLLGVLYGAAIYLNLLWSTRLIPRRRYIIGVWRWRIVMEPR